MSEHKKILFKKALHFAMGTLLVIIFLIALVAASRQQNNKPIRGFEVHLNDRNEFSFLQKKDIETWLLKNRDIKLSARSVNKLNLKRMEAIAETNPWIANAEIYVDNRRVLQIDVVQRDPVARIFDAHGNSYYMDSSLHTMPISNGYIYPAPVFTNVPVYKSDSLNEILKAKMVYLSKIIEADSFWNAQFTQIEVEPDQTFIATPLLGDQKIIIGDTSHIHEKLFNLFAFYKNIPRRIGWDAYKTLDLRYKGQIVAAPTIEAIQPKVVLNNPEIKETATPEKAQSVTVAPKPPPVKAKTQSQKKSDVHLKSKKQENAKKETRKKQAKYIYKG